LPHEPSHLELDGLFSRYFNLLKGLGVLSNTRGSNSWLEYAEVAELKAVALTKLISDLVQERLDDHLYRCSFCLCLFGDPVDEFLLRYC